MYYILQLAQIYMDKASWPPQTPFFSAPGSPKRSLKM